MRDSEVTMPSAAVCADKILTAVPLIMRELWSRLQAEAPIRVTWAQYSLLSLLSERRLTLTEMARYWGVSKPSMSKMVSTLMQRGWIAREEDPKDRRRKPLTLTPTGRQVCTGVRQASRQELLRSLDELDDEQRAQIVAVLDLLVDILA
jgi:DNA-binding MarR family transcriptional regulator